MRIHNLDDWSKLDSGHAVQLISKTPKYRRIRLDVVLPYRTTVFAQYRDRPFPVLVDATGGVVDFVAQGDVDLWFESRDADDSLPAYYRITHQQGARVSEQPSVTVPHVFQPPTEADRLYMMMRQMQADFERRFQTVTQARDKPDAKPAAKLEPESGEADKEAEKATTEAATDADDASGSGEAEEP